MSKIIYAIKVADVSYSGLKILDVKIGQTTNINSTIAQYKRSHREVEVLDLWELNPSKTLSDCEKGIHRIAERYAYERKGEKFIFLQESYKEFSENVNFLLNNVPKSKIGRKTEVDAEEDDSYTGKKPKLIIFKGKKYKVDTWRGVLHVIAKEIYKEQDDFSSALDIKGRKRNYFSKSGRDLVVALKIKGTPYFFEGNINANQIMKIIERLLETFGYDDSDFKIHYK